MNLITEMKRFGVLVGFKNYWNDQNKFSYKITAVIKSAQNN